LTRLSAVIADVFYYIPPVVQQDLLKIFLSSSHYNQQ